MPKRKPATVSVKELTAGQQSALRLIVDFYDQHTRFPSLTEQSTLAGYTRQHANAIRKILAHKGWIKMRGNGTIMSAYKPASTVQLVVEPKDQA